MSDYISDEALANRILDSGIGVHCGSFFGLTRPLDMARTFVNSPEIAIAMASKVETLRTEFVLGVCIATAYKDNTSSEGKNMSMSRAINQACYPLLHDDGGQWKCLVCQQLASECTCKIKEKE